MKLLFLDTETTGNDVAKDRLCQLCYKTEDTIVDELFCPPLPISVKAMSVTHITNRMVEGKKPFSESERKQELQTLLDDHILVAHNASFDIAILEAEGMSVGRHICTLRVARYIDSEGDIPEYNLQYLRYYFDLDIPEAVAHDAAGDVLVLEGVFKALFDRMKQAGNDDAEIIEAMIDISQKPSIIHRLGFGKYRGMKIADIVQKDPGYIDWLIGQKETQKRQGEADQRDEDLLYSLRHYMSTPA